MTEKILIVVLAAALAVFLVVGIWAFIKLNQVLDHLRNISEKAENLADKVGSVGEIFAKAAGPAAVGKILLNLGKRVRHRKKQ